MSPPGEEDLDDPRLWSRQPWQNLKDEKKQNFPNCAPIYHKYSIAFLILFLAILSIYSFRQFQTFPFPFFQVIQMFNRIAGFKENPSNLFFENKHNSA